MSYLYLFLGSNVLCFHHLDPKHNPPLKVLQWRIIDISGPQAPSEWAAKWYGIGIVWCRYIYIYTSNLCIISIIPWCKGSRPKWSALSNCRTFWGLYNDPFWLQNRKYMDAWTLQALKPCRHLWGVINCERSVALGAICSELFATGSKRMTRIPGGTA